MALINIYLHFSCELHLGFAAIPVAFPGFAFQNGIRDAPNFGVPGNFGQFPGFGSPAQIPNFDNQPNFGGMQQNPTATKEPTLSPVAGSNIHKLLSSMGKFFFLIQKYQNTIQSHFSDLN